MPVAMVTKGMRITATWFEVEPQPVALTGSTLKVAAKVALVTGIVQHVRGDDPVTPTTVHLLINPESGSGGFQRRAVDCSKCGRQHIVVDAKHVTTVD